jgi:phosphoglycolate phosphatase
VTRELYFRRLFVEGNLRAGKHFNRCETESIPENVTVIFDLDGTLTDSKPGILRCLRRALEATGTTWEEPLDWFIGPPVEQSIIRLLPSGDEAAREKLINLYRKYYDQYGWTENAIYPGIPELLAALRKQRARLLVCTSKREALALQVLRHFNLDKEFVAIYADRGVKPHSKVGLLATLLAEQGIDPATAFMVGDRNFDIEAAHANYVRAIAANWGYGSAEELAAAHPLAACETPADVLALILSAP